MQLICGWVERDGPIKRSAVHLRSSGYLVIARARHRASKVSSSLGAKACASKALLLLSFSIVTIPSSDSVCDGARASHWSNDLDILGLPSYQHFRPSMMRHDHHVWASGGFSALH